MLEVGRGKLQVSLWDSIVVRHSLPPALGGLAGCTGTAAGIAAGGGTALAADTAVGHCSCLGLFLQQVWSCLSLQFHPTYIRLWLWLFMCPLPAKPLVTPQLILPTGAVWIPITPCRGGQQVILGAAPEQRVPCNIRVLSHYLTL